MADEDYASRFDLKAFCTAPDGTLHEPQYAFCTDRSRRIHVQCARQAGKSQGDVAIGVDNSLRESESTNIYLGLNGPAVRMSIWEPIVLRMWAKYEWPTKWLNTTRMLISFPNGARFAFGGTDDLRHILNMLGNRLDRSVFIVDECQDQGAVLDQLLDSTLPPMLTLTSRLILSGVFPDTPAGRFWRERKNEAWSRHNWGRLANVFTPEARAVLDEHMRVNGITEDDPRIQRDWYGNPVFDPRATAYHYLQERNGYRPTLAAWLAGVHESKRWNDHDLKFATPMTPDDERPRIGLLAALPMPWVERFSFAIDPGAASDRAAIEGWGWGKRSRQIQHVFDWATARGANLTTGNIFAVAGLAHAMYSPLGHCKWRYDAGSSQNTIDNLKSDYGLPIILAATKMDLKGQVDRNNDLLEQGRALVMIGSALEQDYGKAKFDKGARETGQFKWAASWHPDPSEAGRYGIQDYHDYYRPPPTKRPEPDPFESRMRQIEAAQENGENYFTAKLRTAV